jgi:hypothetical protein
MLVIPAKAGIQFLLFARHSSGSQQRSWSSWNPSCYSHLEKRASTPPAEERVTSFFARAKKEVTKKETRCAAPQVVRAGIRKVCADPNYVFVEVA